MSDLLRSVKIIAESSGCTGDIIRALFISVIKNPNNESLSGDGSTAVIRNSVSQVLGSNEDILGRVRDDDIYDIYTGILESSGRERIRMLCEFEHSKQIVNNNKIDVLIRPKIKVLPAGSDVLITDLQSFGENLYSLIEENDKCRFVLVCNDPDEHILYSGIYDMDNVSLVTADISDDNVRLLRYDHIISVPVNKGNVKTGDNTLICSSCEMAVLENMLLHLKKHGSLQIFLQENRNTETGDAELLRSFIRENYYIEEVMTFPGGAFMPCTDLKICLYTIKREYSNYRYIYQIAFEKEKSCCDDITGAFDISVKNKRKIRSKDFYYDEKWNLYPEKKAAPFSSVNLGDVAKLFRGFKITGKDLIKGTDVKGDYYAVLTVKNLDKYDLSHEPPVYVPDSDKEVKESFILRDNDIVITTRGTSFKISMLTEGMHTGFKKFRFITSENIAVIRSDPECIDPFYLMFLLDSDNGRDLIISVNKSSNVLNLNCRDLRTLKIPMISREKQMIFGKEYFKTLTDYKKSIRKALQKRDSSKLKIYEDFETQFGERR